MNEGWRRRFRSEILGGIKDRGPPMRREKNGGDPSFGPCNGSLAVVLEENK
jgi:hypothetical protein